MSKDVFSMASEQNGGESHRSERDIVDTMRLLTPHEVADILGVPEATLAVWRCKAMGPRYSKVGRHVRYRAEDVARFIDDRQWGGTFAEEGEAA